MFQIIPGMQTSTIENELIFDPIKTLFVIEKDTILTEIFLSGFTKLSIDDLKKLAVSNNLTLDTIERLTDIFNNIIIKNKTPKELYIKAPSSHESAPNIEVISEKKTIVKKNRKLPKHYGKKRILEDMQNNNGVTELDRAMLALNTLRNLYTKLKNRGIKDKTNNTKLLSDTDCRDIIATVRIVENKVNNILKRK